MLIAQPEPEHELKISHSQAMTYNACNYKWKLMYKDGWRAKVQDAAPHTGVIIHSLLQVYYDNYNAIGQMAALKKVHEAFIPILQELMEEDENLIVRGHIALKTVEKYIREFSPYEDTKWEVLATEYEFKTPIITPQGRKVTITGFIDVVVKVNGKVWIVDHKSVVSQFWDEMAVMIDSQFTLYAACMSLLGYQVQGIMVNQLNTYQYKGKDAADRPTENFFRRVKTLRSQAEQQNVLREFAFIVDDMIDHEERGRPYKKALTKDCKKCKFVEACMYHMKGIDPEPFLATTHAKRTSRPETDANVLLEIEAAS